MRHSPSLVLFIVTFLCCGGLMSRASTTTQSPSTQPQIAKANPDRIDSLEARTKELEKEIDHATLKNDYIQQIQKQYETYYEKAFSTQVQILSILGIILTVLLFLAGRFGLSIFDRQIQLQLKSATDTLRSEFGDRLTEQLKSLSERNTTQLNELEEGLRKRLAVLQEDLQLRSDFQFKFSMGTSAFVDKVYDSALDQFRSALVLYKKGKDRGTIPTRTGATTARFIFHALKKQDEPEFAQRAKKELENNIYENLHEELTVVLKEGFPELLPLLDEKGLPAIDG